MGKLIICSGQQAQKPYYFKLTNTKIYSIEELCYYIYQNIEAVNEEFFTDTLVTWMTEELQLPQRAQKLKDLLEMKAGLKDFVVCILCSADYYTEIEIKHLLLTIDEITKLSPIEKVKKKADNYLKYRQFTQAATEYQSILNGKDAAKLTTEEYGNIVHNLAVVRLNTVSVSAAADGFQEAYERNHNAESLKQYLYALLISKQEERFLEDALTYCVSKELQEQIKIDIQQNSIKVLNSPEYKVISNLIEYKEAGNINQYYHMTEDLIGLWKQEFRRENC